MPIARSNFRALTRKAALRRQTAIWVVMEDERMDPQYLLEDPPYDDDDGAYDDEEGDEPPAALDGGQPEVSADGAGGDSPAASAVAAEPQKAGADQRPALASVDIPRGQATVPRRPRPPRPQPRED